VSVSTPYNYFNRQVLDPDKHNENIYSNSAGQGIVSEINGGLDSPVADFRIQKEHVWPEEATRQRQEAAVETLDVYSNAFSDTGETTYVPVAGCSVRLHMPYAATLALWQWSAFVHVFRPHTTSIFRDTRVATVGSTSKAFIKAKLDGSSLSHTIRPLPTTVEHAKYDGGTFGVLRSNEARSALYFDMSHMQETVLSGWHDLTLTLYLENLLDSTTASGLYEGNIVPVSEEFKVSRLFNPNDPEGGHDYTFYNRVSFGIRNARVITLL